MDRRNKKKEQDRIVVIRLMEHVSKFHPAHYLTICWSRNLNYGY